MEDDPFADLRADIEADRLYRLDRSNQATALHKEWLSRQTPEALEERKRKKREYEQRTRKKWTAHKMAMRRARKAELVAMFDNKCFDCGGVFPPYVFDFHHLDPSRKTNIVALMYQHKIETLMQEVEGCIMICANCHRIRHAKG